jgi:transcriptional regulator with XRE-family HTH domain
MKEARKLLGWTAVKTAIKFNVALYLIGAFERGQRDLPPRAIRRLRHVLEAADVDFSVGRKPGVKLREAK